MGGECEGSIRRCQNASKFDFDSFRLCIGLGTCILSTGEFITSRAGGLRRIALHMEVLLVFGTLFVLFLLEWERKHVVKENSGAVQY